MIFKENKADISCGSSAGIPADDSYAISSLIKLLIYVLLHVLGPLKVEILFFDKF